MQEIDIDSIKTNSDDSIKDPDFQFSPNIGLHSDGIFDSSDISHSSDISDSNDNEVELLKQRERKVIYIMY